MKVTSRWPSITLEPGQASSDAITAAITLIGCREVARRVKLGATTVSLFSNGKLALPMHRVLHICDACELDQGFVWDATLHGRIAACENHHGFRFNKEDQDRNGHDRAKVLEEEVRAWRYHMVQGETAGGDQDGADCRLNAAMAETDRTKALYANEFGGAE